MSASAARDLESWRKRCAELEEEVAYLRSELGLGRDAAEVEAIRCAFRLRPAGAEVVAALYRAGGRVLDRYQIMEHLPAKDAVTADERSPKAVDVHLVRIRRVIGRDKIENVWGRGFRMTPAGCELVRSVVETRRGRAA